MNARSKTKQDGPSPYATDDAKWQAVVAKIPVPTANSIAPIGNMRCAW